MTTGTITNIANIATALGVVGGAATFLFNVITSWRKARSEKKQRTIEFYRSISDKCDKFLDEIDKKYTEETIIDYEKAEKDYKTFKKIRGYLYLMEEFSVGINNDVFDIEIFEQIAGVYSRIWHWRFKNIIDGIRVKENRPALFVEFTTMVDKIKEMQMQKKKEENKEYTDEWLDDIIKKYINNKFKESEPKTNLNTATPPTNLRIDRMADFSSLEFENRDYIS